MYYYLLFDSEVPLKGTGTVLSAWDSSYGELQMAAEGDFPNQFLCGCCGCPIWWCSLFPFVLLLGSITGGDTLLLLGIKLWNTSRFLNGTSPVAFCWIFVISLWFDGLPFCCYLFFDLEVSPRGCLAPLGTLSIGNSSWLPQQGFLSWFLLDILNTWFDAVLLSCSCFLYLWIAIDSINPHIQSWKYGYNRPVSRPYKTNHYCHTIPGTCLKWMDTWSPLKQASFLLGLRAQQGKDLGIRKGVS